jgi:hypothetical protein
MIKAALVNVETELVENVIIVDTLEDVVPAGYILVEIPIEIIEYTDEEKQLYDILEEIDKDFVRPPYSNAHVNVIEMPVMIGQTKWNITEGFYE